MTRLEESIVHWKEQLANAKADKPLQIGSDHCPLCAYYDEQFSTLSCTNYKDEVCPVAIGTGTFACEGSPWGAVNGSLIGKIDGKRRPGPNTIPAVEAELAFLKSLTDPEKV